MAASQVDVSAKSSADKVKLVLALILFLAGFVVYFALASHSGVTRWAGFLGCLLAGLVVFVFSSAGRSLFGFARDSFKEVRDKVVFPSRKEAVQTTLYVLLFSVTMSVFLWLTDKLLEWILYGLILGWR